MERKANINVQTNSLNYGFNLFSKYKNYSYMCLDENEWKLGFNSYDDIMDKIKALSKEKFLCITR